MRVEASVFATSPIEMPPVGGTGRAVSSTRRNATGRRPVSMRLFIWLLLMASSLSTWAQNAPPSTPPRPPAMPTVPPRVAQAMRFLAQRGWTAGAKASARPNVHANLVRPHAQSTPAMQTWQPLGPVGVLSPNYGLVTGRVSSLALDPQDPTGNRLYVGTTGGGVWLSQNASTADASNVAFTPLNGISGPMKAAVNGSISIGALTVQPGTGVILAGTGDPNDALDSYYGAGILRSADGGNTWDVIQATADQRWAFAGEGFAGFAWSTMNPQLVVAAVSQAWESTLVSAIWPNFSYEGIYYSIDSGASWSLARIMDLNGKDVQGPWDTHISPDGNAATSVVWNPVRNVFIAAVRFHGYYQSTDGVTWTRLAQQPGAGLTTQLCPTNVNSTGSPACPIFRGTLAVNPSTGDTFAWTVDLNNQDQGIWQDVCAASNGTCTSPGFTFAKQWSTAAMDTNSPLGSATLGNGDYNLVLAAVPSSQDTLLLAGANDLWKCSLAMGCIWRNTTNAGTCMSAKVAGYQHALAWDPDNPLHIFIGNDSGLWRSSDAIGETGSVCDSSDASHFQNLNGGLGSLAEVESMSQVNASPYTMMVGLGANGTAGVKSTTAPTANWPQIMDGEGGPVAVDPTNSSNWYVNNGPGVSIHLCAQSSPCTPADFGATPVVSDADVANDGLTMTSPAPFLVDAADPTQLLIGTCRVWRGPANGTGWTAANAISPMFDGARGNPYCHGNALIRSMAAMALPGGGEVVYAGTYGALGGGATLPGHILSATLSANGVWSAWKDLTLNTVTNDSLALNAYGFDISSIFIDPHDSTGNTVYATVAGFPLPTQSVRTVYRSVDGGAHWAYVSVSLPSSPVNSLVIDPQDANTAYAATDEGVYSTPQIANCGQPSASGWTAFGTGLPDSPIVGLSTAPATAALNVLVAATYGRGLWQIPLMTAGTLPTTATSDPTSVSFSVQAAGSASNAQTVTLTNTGGIALQLTSISVSGDFTEVDNCTGTAPPVNAGQNCAIEVRFTPTQQGDASGQLTIAGNIAGGPLTVALSGTGASPSAVKLTPAVLDFDKVLAALTPVGTTSVALAVTVENTLGSDIAINSVAVTGPFVLASNACGTTSLTRNSDCSLTVQFEPTSAGIASGTLTLVDAVGSQIVQLSGTGAAPPTDALSSTSLTFPDTIVGQTSYAQVTLANSGDVALTSISFQMGGAFSDGGSTCTTQLSGRSNCSIRVMFAPTAAGVQTGTLTVNDALRTQTVSLAGTALLAPAFSLSPASLAFAAQPVGVASAPLTLTVTNSGGASMSNVGFEIAGASAASFSMGTTTCGSNLAKGSSCTAQVIFTPAANGLEAASLTVSSATIGVKTATASLSGNGQSATGLAANPAQLTFARQALGQSSAPQTVTITDIGGANAGGLSLSVTGPFTLTQNTCGVTLVAGASCTTGVVFTPMSKGILTGALTASSTTGVAPATAALSGTGGLTGAVQFQPALVSFPTTGVGASSSAATVTVSNLSSTVALSSLAFSVSSDFKLASNACGTSLAAGATCAVAVQFTPGSTGSRSGNLTLTSNSLAAPATVPLSGIGFDFTASAAGSPSKTVASGQSASYTLSLAPSSGVAATFTFQCSSLPAYAACTFSPASETIAADTTGTETIQLSTSQSKAALTRPFAPGAWAPWPLACGLFMIPLAWRKRRCAWFLVVLLALAALGLSSCSSSGGGSGGTAPTQPGSNTTPAGTYTFPVTVTSNGVQHSVTLTLVVD